MTEKRPSRPEHSPRGYEWLPDAYKRAVKPLGLKGREHARQILAEGDVKAILRAPFGGRYSIFERMWDKEPLEKKVYPRFKDGWMRMRLELYVGPYLEGWIFVPDGAFDSLATRRTPFAPDQPGRAKRKINTENEAKLRNRIEAAVAAGRNLPRGSNNPMSNHAMAKELERTHGKELGFAFETFKKILAGNYGPMKRLDIPGLNTHR